MGARDDLLRRQPAALLAGRGAGDRGRAAPQVELCGVFVNASLRGDRPRQRGAGTEHAAAPRRRGPRLLRGGPPPDRRAGDQGRAGRRAPGTCATSSASTWTSTCSTPARGHGRQGMRGGTGETFDWGLVGRPAFEGAADPQRGTDRRERRGGGARGRALCGRHAPAAPRRRPDTRTPSGCGRSSRPSSSRAARARRSVSGRERSHPGAGGRGRERGAGAPLRRPTAGSSCPRR